MSHRALIEAGPVSLRRLCCAIADDPDVAGIDWLDRSVVCVGGRTVAVVELLRSVLACPQPVSSAQIIHPSWWPARRVQLVASAAPADDVMTRPRSALLRETFGASGGSEVVSVVEIAARLVAVTGLGVSAEPRLGSPAEVADAVVSRVTAGMGDGQATVVIDAPAGIDGAAALAAMIAQRLSGHAEVVVIDALPDSVIDIVDTADTPAVSDAVARFDRAAPPSARRRMPALLAAAVGLALPVVVGLTVRPEHQPADTAMTGVYLVDGRVAMQIPADWPVRRITAGPGSERVQVVSPSDPQMLVNLTQSPAAGDTLAAVAEPLQRALLAAEAQTPGVFTDFEAAGSSAGRPAVTYREVRGDHEVSWAVLVDGAVRIGIGCQHGSGSAEAIREVCERAVRSAHAIS